MSKATKIPRKQVDSLVALAAAAALDRLDAGEADEDDIELLNNANSYFEDRESGKVK